MRVVMGPSYVIKEPFGGRGQWESVPSNMTENALLQIKMPFTICTRLPPWRILRGFRPHKSSGRGRVGGEGGGTVPRTIYQVFCTCSLYHELLRSHIVNKDGPQIRTGTMNILNTAGNSGQGVVLQTGEGVYAYFRLWIFIGPGEMI